MFLRFLEDKLLEPVLFVSRFARSKTPWQDFTKDCILLNAKYNGVVFRRHFIDEPSFKPPAALTFIDVCNRLTNPDYYYDVIPIHILGSIYERFLGSVVHATAKQVTVQQKPQVKKAGGVYYTPEYIVSYIVKNTIGKLIEDKSPLQISRMRFADIACGSGSFLISAFGCILDYHSHWYNDNPKKAKEDGCIYIKEDDRWVVSLKQKREILVNNIYGVDIDRQAVEVTELSLYLKLLEDETTATAHEMSSLFTLLPDLSNNILCGNSLIKPDILMTDLFSGEEERKLNPMSFASVFPDVMDKGGFDAIVGNPPWVRQELISDSKSYFESHYQTYHGSADLYQYFIEKGISLLNPQGIFSYIVPNKWMRAAYGTPLRAWLKKHKIKEITDFGDLRVFETVTTYPCIVIAQKASVKSDYSFDVTQVSTLDFADLGDYVKANRYRITTSSLDESGWNLASETEQKLLQKINKNSVSLDTYIDGKIYRGILTGLDKAFVLDEATAKQLIKSDKNSKKIIKPYQAGKDIKRYSFSNTKRYVIFLPKGFTKSNCQNKNYWNWFLKEYPAVAKHLAEFEEPAKKRYDKGDFWWELRACEYYNEFAKPKITFLKFQVKPTFSYDTEEFVVNSAGFIIPQDDKYLLGILNSPLGWYIISKLCTQIQNGYQLIWKYLKKFPIPKINFSNKTEKATHDKIVQLVNQIIEAKKKLATATSDRDKDYYTRRTKSIDIEINREVYKLYGLSKDEIDIIEKING